MSGFFQNNRYPSSSPNGNMDIDNNTTTDVKKKLKTNILPVTIKQVLNGLNNISAGNEVIIIDNIEVSQVCFVCVILRISEEPNTKTFIIDDGTGLIPIRLWNNMSTNSYEQVRLNSLHENMYVRVYTNVSIYQNTKSLIIRNIQAVTDFNEITYHHLLAMKQHVLNLKGNKLSKGNSFNMPGISDHESIKNTLHEYIRNKGANGNEGVWLNDMIKELNQFTKPQIESALKTLSDDGSLFCTIDDHHYKATS